MRQLFRYTPTLNAILYALQRLGGMTDMHKLCKILYFADQKHLSRYGRSITGDTYIKMTYGPVPSKVDDILKAVRGDSFFSGCVSDLDGVIAFENRYNIRGLVAPEMDQLSETDIECLTEATEYCRDKTFAQLTQLSHGLAWSAAGDNQPISVKDIMREAGDEEDYIDYIAGQIRLQSSLS
ncbi:MAG: SocA family protein [Muribaculaceae bacterium]|nr:SocA family protein [Muribaculaceae bacterium]MDE6831472.1 SocA family protein [Muribaculaceae bacterium]